MTTLTDFVTYYKKAIIWFGILILVIAALTIFFNLLGTIKDSLTGSNKLAPTVAFGKLPQLDLSEGVRFASGTVYKIETVSGDLPNLPASSKVFSFEEETATFSDLEDSKAKARALGLSDQPFEYAGGKVKFRDPNDPDKTLTVETINQAFKLEGDYLENPEIVSNKIESEDTVKKSIVDFFEEVGVSVRNFQEDDIVTEFYKIEEGQLVEALSLSNANLVKVIFNNPKLADLEVFDIRLNNPNVWALSSGRKIVAAEYNINRFSKHKFATYPLKSSQQAFEELKNGKGVLNGNFADEVFEIRKVKLGYLDTRAPQRYLQPVFIFEGDDGLAAFVGAVDSAWINPN